MSPGTKASIESLSTRSALVVESDAARCKGRGRLKDVLSDDGKVDEGRKG